MVKPSFKPWFKPRFEEGRKECWGARFKDCLRARGKEVFGGHQGYAAKHFEKNVL